MQKYLFLALAGACSTVAAQTPATNPMPDGSRDMYIGIGVQSAPRYDGASHNRTQALPVLQVQWSNGIFISGTTLGMHLSDSPSLEFGPLLSLAPRRDKDGLSLGVGGVSDGSNGRSNATIVRPPGGFRPGNVEAVQQEASNRLLGMDVVERRVVYGGFLNYYLTPKLRLANSLSYGAGNDRKGARLFSALQYMMPEVAPHHTIVLTAGASIANRAHTATWYGLTKDEGERTNLGHYAPGGGVQDVRAGVRWNWALSPSWMMTTGVQVNRLVGDAKASPLVERATTVSASTALAYRF